MKKLFLIVLTLAGVANLTGQTAADALRYSLTDVVGTARTVGIGGGIGALGADFSVLSTNPAGLASYRISEFVFTPSFYIANTTSTLEGEGISAFEENKNRFGLNNIGVVMTSTPRSSRWKTFNVGIGLNQIANFNQRFFYEGKTKGSYADRFLDLAYDSFGNGLAPEELDGFESGLAYATGALYDGDFDNTNGIYLWTNDFQLDRNTEVLKEQSVKTSGSINELVFSFAGNLENKLMFGATIGVPFLSFKEEKIYSESDPNDEVPAFNSLEFKEELTTSGIGINVKFGLIYRLNQMIRLGAAVHTPTALSLTDNFTTEMTYGFNDVDGVSRSFSEDSPEGTFDYKLKTPWRYIGSAGVIIRKYGFLSAEVEWVDHTASNFNLTVNSNNSADRAYEEEVNTDIENSFASALNIRLGGEYAYKKFRFRAGYGISGTPYAEDDITNNSYSLGLGIRERSFFIDLAYRRNSSDEGYLPFQTEDPTKQPLVNNSIDKDRILLTLGFKF